MQAKFQTLPLGAIKPSGWILAQLRGDLTQGFASRLDALTEHAATDLFSHRIESSADTYAWWDSETRGNWLWGYTMMAGLADLPEHKERVKALLESLKHTQDADGYIGIYSNASRYQHGESENGELWGQSRALLALLAQYELTGDPTCLRAVQAAADLTLQHYTPEHPHFQKSQNYTWNNTGLTHALCYVDVVEWLYAITGEEQYRDFGVWLYEDFNKVQLPFFNDDLVLQNLLNPYHHFAGHAVHTVEHLRALLFANQMGHLPQTAPALQSALKKLRCYTLPSGAVLGDEGIHGMPTPDAGQEYCTMTEMLFSLSSALQKSADPTFGDWIEILAFNASQGARFPDGSGIAYLSLDTRLTATNDRPDSYSQLAGKGGRFKYSPTHEDVACCCNPNAVRLMPHYISRMWMRLEDRPGFAAAAYGPCILSAEINGVFVTITEQTAYPFSDTIHFSVSTQRNVDFSLVLRKPAFAGNLEIQGADAREENGWLVIEKIWSQGDSFSLVFHPKIEAIVYPTGEYALRRGVLQYALPVDFRRMAIKDYPVSGFHDYEIKPENIEQGYTPVILDASQLDYGLTFESAAALDIDHCWENPPVHLRMNEISLVPLGCTVLRRAAFPLKQIG